MMLKMVPETPLQFGVAERLSRTFRVESTGLRAEAPKMLWADSVCMAYLIYHIPYISTRLRIPEEEWRGKDTSLAHLKVFGYDSFIKVKDVCGEAMKCTFIGNGLDEMRYSFWDMKSHQVIRRRDITFMDSIHGARRFEDSGRSDEEYSKDGASSKEGGSETPQVRRSTRESRTPVRYSQSANYLLLTENNEPESYSEALNYQQERMHHKACGCSWLKKSRMEAKVSDMAEFNKPKWYLPLVFEVKDRFSTKQVLGYVLIVDSWNEEPCRDVHQVGDESEVEVLRNFNWPPSELITEDGILPVRGYSLFNNVSSGYLISKVS
ncbi:hypothetical protein Tco_1223038 [Tanacetum coccineum]